jgi:hypothetical protein
MRLRPECYRKRTYGAESSPAFSSLLLVRISRSGPASVCALILNCGNARTCNSPGIVQRMPNNGRYELVYLCTGLYVINLRAIVNSALSYVSRRAERRLRAHKSQELIDVTDAQINPYRRSRLREGSGHPAAGYVLSGARFGLVIGWPGCVPQPRPGGSPSPPNESRPALAHRCLGGSSG